MRSPLYVVHSALACAVLYFALDLSRAGRGVVDWIVLGLVSCAILWNVVQLGRRLHRCGGGTALWHMLRTLLFWVIGLVNTVLASPEDVGTLKNRLGWAFLVIAAIDSIALLRREVRCRAQLAAQA